MRWGGGRRRGQRQWAMTPAKTHQSFEEHAPRQPSRRYRAGGRQSHSSVRRCRLTSIRSTPRVESACDFNSLKVQHTLTQDSHNSHTTQPCGFTLTQPAPLHLGTSSLVSWMSLGGSAWGADGEGETSLANNGETANDSAAEVWRCRLTSA